MMQYLLHKETKSIYKANKFLLQRQMDDIDEDTYIVSCIVAKTIDSLMLEFYTHSEIFDNFILINVICELKKIK